MSDCLKRQNENYKGEVRYRCINPEATVYRHLVVLPQCAACPVQVLRKPDDPPCKEKKLDSPLPILEQHEGYPDCPYREDSDGRLICNITLLPVTPEVCHRCDAGTRTHTATLGDKISNYSRAIRGWFLSGQPNRTPEEIKELFEMHCNVCDRYDREAHACKNCGCSVSESAEPLDNKLAMATEHCPLGRF